MFGKLKEGDIPHFYSVKGPPPIPRGRPKNRSAAIELIRLRDIAREFTQAGWAIPDVLGDGMKKFEEEL